MSPTLLWEDRRLFSRSLALARSSLCRIVSLSLLSLSVTQGEEGTLIHSLTCRSHTQSRGHTHSHLPLSHRVEGTLILTSKLKRRVESTLTPTLSLSLTHTMEELSLSLSHTLAHP